MFALENLENSEWQLDCGFVGQRGARLLASAQWADCSFLLGQREVPQKAHRLLLAMASPVFQAMFYGPLAERDAPVPLPDIRPEVFMQVLRYIYTDQINLDSYILAIQLYFAAQKYMLRRLQRLCTKFLCHNLSPQNACHIFEFAYCIGDKKLKLKSLKIIKSKTKQAISDSSFKTLALSTAIYIFSMDDITIDNELDLFEAAERYYLAHQENLDTPLNTQDDQIVTSSERNINGVIENKDEVIPMADGNNIGENEEDMELVKNQENTSSDSPLTSIAIEKEEDRARSEATFRFTVHNFKNLQEAVISPVCYVRELPWQIMVELSQKKILWPGLLKQLDVFLKCRGSKCSSWSCEAKAELKLVPLLPENRPFSKKITKNFRSEDACGGFLDFMAWKESKNDDIDKYRISLQGELSTYLLSDSITLEVHITAEEPIGIPLTMKKLEEMKDLSMHTLVSQIRFLTLSAKQLARYKPKSSLLSNNDILALTMNIITPDTYMPLPEGFSRCRMCRKP